MEKRIELEMRGRLPAEVSELNLDNCRATQMAGLTDEFKNLEALSLINVGLTTLKEFPALPSLKRLEMSDNRIASGLENLHGSPNISHLNLSGNRIKDVASLEPLKEMKNLKSLDLFNCDVTQADDYRENVFTVIPHLKYLDGFDKEDKEAEDSEEEALGDGDEDEDDIDGDAGEEDGNHVDISDDDVEDGDEDDDEVGLGYLQSSKVLRDEDETEDYAAGGEDEGEEDDDVPDEDDEEDESAEADANESRGRKRKHEEEEEEGEQGD